MANNCTSFHLRQQGLHWCGETDTQGRHVCGPSWYQCYEGFLSLGITMRLVPACLEILGEYMLESGNYISDPFFSCQ